MANYPTLSYTQLQDRFKALTGLESLQVTDSKFLRDLVNRRVRIAYERYPWPTFTIVGEPLVLSSNSFLTYNVNSGSGLANNANVVFRIHKEDPVITRYPDEHTFLQEVNPISGNPQIKIITPENLSGKTIYVTYRKDLTDVVNAPAGATTGYFGDEDGDNEDIPYLFFEYATHGALADFLRGDGQNSKAQAEEQYAESLLIHEIDKVSNQGRQFRHDILQYRPPSQFNRHNVAVGGAPIGQAQAQLRNDVQ
jgi:hypothetical protein